MANFAHTNQRLLQAIFQITRPQVRPSLNIYSGRQQRSPFSGARPQSLPANGFSISFPIEFDEVAKELVSKTKVATQKNTKKPKSKGLEVSKYPQKPTSKNPRGTVATGKTQTAGRPTGFIAAEKVKQTPRTAEETWADPAHTVVELDNDVLDSYDPLDASADLPFEPEDMPPSPATAVISTQTPKNKQAASPAPSRSPPRPKEDWQIQKAALLSKFPPTTGGWNPRKKLSPDTIEGIRALHEQYPDKYTTPILASEFKVSAEAVRRILRSKWRPETAEKMEERRERWARRHDRIWDTQAELGLRPKRTKVMKMEREDAFEEGVRARQILVNR